MGCGASVQRVYAWSRVRGSSVGFGSVQDGHAPREQTRFSRIPPTPRPKKGKNQERDTRTSTQTLKLPTKTKSNRGIHTMFGLEPMVELDFVRVQPVFLSVFLRVQAGGFFGFGSGARRGLLGGAAGAGAGKLVAPPAAGGFWASHRRPMGPPRGVIFARCLMKKTPGRLEAPFLFIVFCYPFFFFFFFFSRCCISLLRGKREVYTPCSHR